MKEKEKLSHEEKQQNRIQSARATLLICTVLTVVNIALMFLPDADLFFLFSAEIPYFSVAMGMAFLYEGIMGEAILAFAIALVSILLILLCWVKSDEHPRWLTIALGLFVLDTGALVILFGFGSISLLDAIFHLWILFDLGRAVWGDRFQPAPTEEPEGQD